MTAPPTLDDLWEMPGGTAGAGSYSEESIRGLPEPVRRYFRHGMDAGAPLASSVRLKMHGQIRLKKWLPFEAEEVLNPHKGFAWKVKFRMGPLPCQGLDYYLDGSGGQVFKLFGFIPIFKSSGPDITRSGRGRVFGEAFWNPPSLLPPRPVSWEAVHDLHIAASWKLDDESGKLNLILQEDGRPCGITLERFGNPGGGAFDWHSFGGVIEAEKTFSGITIPTRLRAGWWYGSERFREGEFFRATIDDARFH
jgi:hypothetical protein